MSTQAFPFQSAYARRLIAKGNAEGRAEGEARLVLAVLAARGFDVPEQVRARVTGCYDPDQLEAWGCRAAVIRTIDELFDSPRADGAAPRAAAPAGPAGRPLHH